ncbi:uncharacterized protein LOC123550854 isoform X2 [Mercenaria mercenaria]|uniref:uncharacterized protein LOC123550854 isoform X2 n=1 Tax=Mercenaria mercenaria TaxID=6596 RepID=UPI00234E8FDA|nr:uncharacterized protein LOC123550854 isoform X2 [Mercenaria mercenaria]
MAMNEETGDSKRYLRHLLLLEQAAPLALKAVINCTASESGKTLESLLLEHKDNIKTNNNEEFQKLFQDNEVNTHLDSWDIRLICFVTLVLFESHLSESKLEAVKCIRDQQNDLDNYARSAELSFSTFECKWNSLSHALLELMKGINEQVTLECKTMMHSFYSEPIHVDWTLIRKMQQAKDVNVQLKMVIQEKVSTTIHGTKEKTDEPDDMDDMTPETVFTEALQDKFAYVGESAVLVCTKNTAEPSVKWLKDYDLLEETNTLKFVNDKCSHWMVLSDTKVEDSGLYSCVCGTISTSAVLKISDKPLDVIQDLAEHEITENMDVSLVCKVYLYTEKPIWRHNNKEIKPDGRVRVSSLRLEHRLTISRAIFQDDGEYSVTFGDLTLKTYLTVKGDYDTEHKKQLKEGLFKDWIRGVLGLKYLKSGLEDVTEKLIKKQHSTYLSGISSNGTQCTQCTAATVVPSHNSSKCKIQSCLCKRRGRIICPNNFCGQYFDFVIADHRYNEPLLKNTDIQKWSSSEHWSLATCFISTPGYKGKTSAKEVDCAGLLSIFINNKVFSSDLGDIGIDGQTDCFKKARDVRNELLHNPNYELSTAELCDYIDLFKSVLEVKDKSGGSPLLQEPKVKEAIVSLNELQQNDIELYTTEDLQQKIRDNGMEEAAKKVKEFQEESMKKLQLLEEKLKLTEQELKLMRELRSSPRKSKHSIDRQVPFELILHVSVDGPTADDSTRARERVYQVMRHYLDNQSLQQGETKRSTDQSVCQLLDCLGSMADLQIVSVSSAGLNINCFTCEAIEEFLKVINGSDFHQKIMMLRKSLEKELAKPYEIVASCSFKSIEATRKSLRDQGVVKDLPNDFACEKHDGTPCRWYCSDHVKFCCSTCKEKDHGSCMGMKQVLSDRTYREKDVTSLSITSKIGEYDVRVNKEDSCTVRSICVLPNGNILIVDARNDTLKKLDSSYKFVGECRFTHSPRDVCYIGSNRAAVILRKTGIQFVNTQCIYGRMKQENTIQLDHECWGLDCYGDTLFYTCNDAVYTYNLERQQKRVLCEKRPFLRIAVSNDGERIYVAVNLIGLTVIDNQGNNLSTLRTDGFKDIEDVCVTDDGTLLVLDKLGYVHHVDCRGERVLGTVMKKSDTKLLCYDSRRRRMIVGCTSHDHIKFYDLQ